MMEHRKDDVSRSHLPDKPKPCSGQLSWLWLLFGLIFGSLIHFPAVAITPVETDRDQDGLIDLDEVSARVTVSAGPSNQSVFITTTKYSIQNGTRLRLRGEGKVTGDTRTGLTSGPEGLSARPAFPLVLDSAPFLALIGRIENNAWFLIGEEHVVNATASGVISLAINDVAGSYQNNSGSFTVIIGRGLGSNPDKPDTDGDGYLDGADGAPTDPTEHLDTDHDDLGNNLDPDDDNDGLYDNEETGKKFLVPAKGTPASVPIVATDFHLLAGEYLNFSATGTITDGANQQTSFPQGRSDLNTDGINLLRNGEEVYKLLGRIGIGEWFGMGETSQVGFNPAISIFSDTKHIGDNTVSTWSSPAPAGTELSFEVVLPEIPLNDALLRCQVWSTRENNLLLWNNQFIGRLCANRNNTFVDCEIPVPLSVLHQGSNTLRVTAGQDDDQADFTSLFDDFMVRNMRIDFSPTPYRLVRIAPRHLGDETVNSFEVPEPEGTSASFGFSVTHLPGSGQATLLVDSYDVTTGRPAIPVKLNGTVIGNLCARNAALSDYWQQCRLEFDVNLLQIGVNQVEIQSVTGVGQTGYDDFMVRFLTLKLPYTEVGDEIFLSYNEQVGSFDDNTGAYSVTIGSGTPTNPLVADTDGDGVNDGDEFAAGTDPTNPASHKNYDLNRDGTINKTDLFAFSRLWHGIPTIPVKQTNRVEPQLKIQGTGFDALDLIQLKTVWHPAMSERR